MKNNVMLLFVLLSQYPVLIAQTSTEKMIIGKVVSDTLKLNGISVVNCMNKMMAVTDSDGCFSIQAKEGDILNLSGIDYKYLKRYIYRDEFKAGIMEVNMIFNSVELDEVVVNKYANITSENMGIIPRGQIKFTQQERKLYSNSGWFSAVTGELKTLKMNVEVEKKEILMKKLEFMFQEKFYINSLKIPEELIKGFQYYCVENSKFVKYLNDKNKIMTQFVMTDLASIYNRDRLKN